MSENWEILSFWLKLAVFAAVLVAILSGRIFARILGSLPAFVPPRTQSPRRN